jgi:hypothetical protein
MAAAVLSGEQQRSNHEYDDAHTPRTRRSRPNADD